MVSHKCITGSLCPGACILYAIVNNIVLKESTKLLQLQLNEINKVKSAYYNWQDIHVPAKYLY